MKLINIVILFLSYFLLLGFRGSLNAQEQGAIIYKKVVGSTVTVYTDEGIGSGFFVAEDIIATNLHVIEGATSAYIQTYKSTTRYNIEGYLAYDEEMDLVLLKVSGIKKSPLKISKEAVQPGQKLYLMGSPGGLEATISEGIVSAYREAENLIQVSVQALPGNSGGPALNSKGEVIGILRSGLTEMLNYIIPVSQLQVLLKNKSKTPASLSNLPSNKNVTLALKTTSYESPGLTLDYVIYIKGFTIFLFTYSYHNNEKLYEFLWKDGIKLYDLDTGEEYVPIETSLPDIDKPIIIYNNTNIKFFIAFPRLPKKTKNIRIRQRYCNPEKICFDHIFLKKDKQVSDFNFEDYTKNQLEGTVSFYSVYDKGGTISIYVNGYYLGELKHYLKTKSNIQCGQPGALTLRLPEGTYAYTAKSASGLQWKGTFTVKSNGCAPIGFRGPLTRKWATGLLLGWPSTALALQYDWVPNISFQLGLDPFGENRGAFIRGLLRFHDLTIWKLYAFGTFGIWSNPYVGAKPGFSTGVGSDFLTTTFFRGDKLPLALSPEIGFGLFTFGENDYSSFYPYLAIGMYYRF